MSIPQIVLTHTLTMSCGVSGLPAGILELSAWLFPWGPGAWLVLFSLLLHHTDLINVPS